MRTDRSFGWFLFIFLLMINSSCSEKSIFGEGEGTLRLKVDMQSNLPIVSTRATLTDAELLQRCKVYIRNPKGLVRKFDSWQEMPEAVQLVADSYKAEVIAGDSVPASFTDSYYRGTKEFVITSGQSMSVKVGCKIQNTVTCVALSQDLAEAFSSYKIVLNTSRGKLTYTPENIDDAGYFMIPDDERLLSWAFEGVMKGDDGALISNKGKIDNVKGATKYLLTFGNSSPEVGGGMITVTVESKDLSVPDQDLVVDLEAEPIIKQLSEGQGWQEISGSVYRAQNSYDPDIVLGVASNVPLTSVSINSENFQELNPDFPKTTTGYDFLKMAQAEVEELGRLGLEFRIQENCKSATITFSEDLRKKITANIGTYKFDLSMKDEKGRTKIKILSVVVSNLYVITLQVNESDVWSKRVTLRGRILDSKVQAPRFRYKKTSDEPWTEIQSTAVTINGIDYTYVLTGLESNTEYEYCAMDADVVSPVTCSFKTEEERQLPNSGFEDWHGSMPLYIYASGDEMFWDSGNTGSATGGALFGKNVTTSDSDIKKTGKSAKLKSQYVGVGGSLGAFAAGNIYIGKFLKVDGTDGILRFGRPWGFRPSALKLYYKYNCGTVDYSKLPEFPTGRKDIGIVYVALGDWPHQTAEGESDIPVLVKTKEEYRQLFDPNSSNVIGYGEYPMEVSTEGDEMIEITIPIKYRSNRKPTDIIVVGSASKYGDYFTGSTGSTLWLDDLKLIYEDVEFEK